jgi:hypothetical protein
VVEPLFWLGLSLLLVAASLTAVLVVALPAFQELARAARSAEKLFDTLSRELPPTLEAIRLTGLEISDLTDDLSEGVQSAGDVVKQVDQSLVGVRRQAQRASITSRGIMAGFKAAWKSWTRKSSPTSARRAERLSAAARVSIDLKTTHSEDYYLQSQWSERTDWEEGKIVEETIRAQTFQERREDEKQSSELEGSELREDGAENYSAE